MLISKAAERAYVDRRFESWLWMKKLQKEQLLKELRQMHPRPRFKTEPWLHQLVCFWLGLHNPRFLFLLDMGAGKSKILLDLITHFQREKRLTKKALITVPRMINMGSWEEDTLRHSNLEPWLCLEENIEGKWEQLANPKGDVTFINYQGLTLACCDKKGKKLVRNDKKVAHLRGIYGFLGMDESHKLGNQDSTWHSLAWQIGKNMPYCYATTGTLFGKDPEPAWAQFKLVDRGETFGEHLGMFRHVFYNSVAGPWKTEFHFRRDRLALLNSMMQNRSIRYNEREFSDVPKEMVIPMTFRMSEEQREHYLMALEGLINAGGVLQQTDAAYTRMRQICNGFVSWRDGTGKHTVEFEENPKLLALEGLLEQAPDDKWVVSTEYTHTGQIISNMLTKMKIKHVWLYGGTKHNPLELRRQFMQDDDCKVFLMQSESGGTGVDGLQKVSKRLVFYECPPSPTTRKQVLKRLVRPGQTEHTFIYDFTMRGSVEKRILEDCLAGVDFYASAVDGGMAGKLRKIFEYG